MNPHDLELLARKFPLSESTRKRNTQAGGVASSPKPEQIVCHEPLATVSGEKENSYRYAVRICSYRTRLLDADNLTGKCFVDCLRYGGIIPDDTAAIMDYSISQQKVKTKKEERTEIEVTAIPKA